VPAVAGGHIHELGEMLEKRLPAFEKSTLLEVQVRMSHVTHMHESCHTYKFTNCL